MSGIRYKNMQNKRYMVCSSSCFSPEGFSNVNNGLYFSTFNWVLGNTNPMDFSPPFFCAKAKLDETEAPVNMFTALKSLAMKLKKKWALQNVSKVIANDAQHGRRAQRSNLTLCAYINMDTFQTATQWPNRSQGWTFNSYCIGRIRIRIRIRVRDVKVAIYWLINILFDLNYWLHAVIFFSCVRLSHV